MLSQYFQMKNQIVGVVLPAWSQNVSWLSDHIKFLTIFSLYTKSKQACRDNFFPMLHHLFEFTFGHSESISDYQNPVHFVAVDDGEERNCQVSNNSYQDWRNGCVHNQIVKTKSILICHAIKAMCTWMTLNDRPFIGKINLNFVSCTLSQICMNEA